MRIILPLLMILALTACNTISGLGQDIEAGGNAIANSAEKTKRNM